MKLPPIDDGLPLSQVQQWQVNDAFARLFQPGDPVGESVLRYLDAIRLTIVPPSLPGDALRHREGMRDLVRVIRTRIELGREQGPLHRPEPGTGP